MLNNELFIIFFDLLDFFEPIVVELYTEHSAIFIVIASYMLISYIGNRVAIYQQQFSKIQEEIQFTFFPADKLPQGLHINGLTSSLRQNLNDFIKKKDMLRLAIFLASHHPSVSNQQDKTELNKELNKFLNKTDVVSIKEHSKINQKLINEKFIIKFGDLLFMENFIMYHHLCRSDPAIFHIPENSGLRHMFDTFVKTGLSKQGLSISLEKRLHILSLEELQTIAKEVNIDKNFSSVEEAAVILATSPLTVIRLASKYSSDDLYLLKIESWDIKAVEKEWSAYNAYAKLLCA